MNREQIIDAASRILSGAISVLVATIGVRNTVNLILDPIKQKMVDEQRGPTDAEFDIVFGAIKANTDIIKGTDQ